MLLGENDISEVVQAVRAILDSNTLNQERQKCTQVRFLLYSGTSSTFLQFFLLYCRGLKN